MAQKFLTSALIAGFAAGLLAAILQFVFVQPVLLHAELFEGGDLIHFGAGPTAATPESLPGPNLVRDGMSIAFSGLIYVGYAFILAAAMGLARDNGHVLGPKGGLVWGACGFVAVQLAPAFGLPPELPGMSAADITERQIWWFATAIGTAIALWLIAFGRGWAAWGVALILLAAPHLIGAPAPETLTGPAPPELGAAFASRALGVGLAAWTALGAMLAAMLSTAED